MNVQKFERLVEANEGLGMAAHEKDEGHGGRGQATRQVVVAVVRAPSSFCCGASARTWTKVGIILNMVGCGLVFAVLALALIGIFEATLNPDTLNWKSLSYGEQSQLLAFLSASQVILAACLIAVVISFLVSALALHGVNTNKVGLITFWMIFQGIGVAGQLFQFFAIVSAATWGDVLFGIVVIGVEIFFLVAAIKCRDEAVRTRTANLANYKFSA